MSTWQQAQLKEQSAGAGRLNAANDLADVLAWAVSIVCVPPVMILPLMLLVVRHEADAVTSAPAVVVFVVATAILPLLFIYAAYRSGRVRSYRLASRSERLQPAIFATLCAVAAYPVLRGLGASTLLLNLDAALAVQLATLALVTVWWKISYHAASAAGLALLALLMEGAALALPFVMLAGLVGWARVRRNRHTPLQVLFGWLSCLPLLWWTWPA